MERIPDICENLKDDSKLYALCKKRWSFAEDIINFVKTGKTITTKDALYLQRVGVAELKEYNVIELKIGNERYYYYRDDDILKPFCKAKEGD